MNKQSTYIDRLPKDLIKEIDRYLDYAKHQEQLFVNLIKFYIRQTGGEVITRQEFEEDWYNNWRELTQFFRKHQLSFDIYYQNKNIVIDYNERDLINDKIIYNMIKLVLTWLGPDPDIAEDLNLVLKKNHSYFRVLVMGKARHRYFEITKIVPVDNSTN